VIVPGYTFMASAVGVTAVGAVPVVAEVDESLTLDPEDVARKIGPRTRAIMPVHMLGLPCNMDAIMALARERGVLVLEDACQADGGSYKGRRLGSIGDVGAFSFNHYKIITCGEGGAVTTDDEVVYQRALIHHDGGAAFRQHARSLRVRPWTGSNFRLNEILGAILRVQLGRLEAILSALRREKRMMVEELGEVAGLRLSPMHDPEGDCGTHVALLCESEGEARRVLRAAEEAGLGGFIPLDTGIHVYSNWEPILEKRGAHHPRVDPFALAEGPVEYSRDMCPRTLEIVARTVCLTTSVRRSEEELMGALGRLKGALAGAPAGR